VIHQYFQQNSQSYPQLNRGTMPAYTMSMNTETIRGNTMTRQELISRLEKQAQAGDLNAKVLLALIKQHKIATHTK